MSGRLLCVGDLNADITITTDGEIAVGSDTPGRVELSGGGSAANVSAWALRAGLDVRFVGVVGDDHLGDFLVDDLAAVGVDVRPIRRVATASRSIAAIVSRGGDRSMVSDLGTATVMTTDDLDASWFDGVTWLHMTAYTYFPSGGRAVLARLIDLACERSIEWSLDPSSSKMLASESTRDESSAAFNGAGILFPNLDEAEWLTGEPDPATAAQSLLDLAETVAVTCGERGAVVARRGQSTFHVDPAPGPLVNSLGCGDAFAAGFLAGRLGGLDDSAAAQLAVSTAALALARSTSR